MTFLKKYGWAVFYGVLLTVFTLYVVLDTFVITRVYVPVPEEQETTTKTSVTEVTITEMPTTTEESTSLQVIEETTTEQKLIINDTMYKDGNITITLTEYREYDTAIYVADVRLSSPEYLKTALAKGAYGKNIRQKTSEISDNNGGILAVNGDFYGVQESGYVLRNGILYRGTAARDNEDLVIYKDGSFGILEEKNVSAESLVADGAVQILAFGPGLVMNGEIAVTEDEEVGTAKASNPRTAIGMVDDLHYLFVVSDGRTRESAGLKLYELAEFMQSLGVVTAYNLDGGGSATMYFNGRVINKPTTNGKSFEERNVSDIVYIGY
ncbi:MAG: phosphodiester glycosidase family protein [Lachnospiraceae bacterium]|nr:phosphodiester glycosidase family protein [Lachnospiraceae bacterium]